MKYHELQSTPRSSKIRRGRGNSAGRGTTAGRGTKGQSARTGSKAKPGFEGGQNPLMQRLPKLRGFKSFKPKAENVYTSDLENLSATNVDAHVLAENNLVTNPYVKIKLLAAGELTKKKTVKLPAASTQARAALEKAGGSFERVDVARRPAKTKSDKKS